MLDDTLRRFVTRYPDTEIAMHDDRPSELREALRRGDFELVLLPQRSHDLDDLHYYPLGEDRLFAILPEAHALAALEIVPLAHLAEQPLVCGDGCPFWEAAERSFREPGLAVTPKAIATRAEWLFELVGAGVGIGVARPSRRPAARAWSAARSRARRWRTRSISPPSAGGSTRRRSRRSSTWR